MQIPAFSINTKGTWVLKFDYIIADALELGPLRMEAVSLPTEFYSKVVMCEDKGLPFEAVRMWYATALQTKQRTVNGLCCPSQALTAITTAPISAKSGCREFPRQLSSVKVLSVFAGLS